MNVEEAKREFPQLNWETILPEEWLAQPENTIGGWCVTLARIDGTPADGNRAIALFTDEDAAKHIARIHNYWLEYTRSVRDGKEAPCVNCFDGPPATPQRPDTSQ